VKKAWMMGSVVMVAGGLMLSAGCGTTRPPMTQEPVAPVVMPPSIPPPEVVAPKVEEVKVPVVAEVATKTYVVKAGDSISRIASRYKVPAKDILKMNNITNANKIRVGQKLTLPGYVDLNAPAPVKKAHKKAVKTAKSGKAVGKVAAKTEKDKVVAPVDEGAGAVPPVTAVVPPPKSNEVLHVVEANQDLSSIAMMYGVRAEEVIRLNSLSSPDVKVGQTLKIPPPAE